MYFFPGDVIHIAILMNLFCKSSQLSGPGGSHFDTSTSPKPLNGNSYWKIQTTSANLTEPITIINSTQFMPPTTQQYAIQNTSSTNFTSNTPTLNDSFIIDVAYEYYIESNVSDSTLPPDQYPTTNESITEQTTTLVLTPVSQQLTTNISQPASSITSSPTNGNSTSGAAFPSIGSTVSMPHTSTTPFSNLDSTVFIPSSLNNNTARNTTESTTLPHFSHPNTLILSSSTQSPNLTTWSPLTLSNISTSNNFNPLTFASNVSNNSTSSMATATSTPILVSYEPIINGSSSTPLNIMTDIWSTSRAFNTTTSLFIAATSTTGFASNTANNTLTTVNDIGTDSSIQSTFMTSSLSNNLSTRATATFISSPSSNETTTNISSTFISVEATSISPGNLAISFSSPPSMYTTVYQVNTEEIPMTSEHENTTGTTQTTNFK